MAPAACVRGVLGVLGVLVLAEAHAENGRREDAPAPAPRDHARDSTTVYLSSAWSPGPMVPIRVGADGVLRVHRNHVAFEARIGAGGAATIVGLGGAFVGHVGVSLGAALPVRRRIVLTPMVAYDGFIEWEQHGATMTIHYATLQIPLSFVLDRGVVVEPFIQVGFARYQGVHDPVVVVGPRLGIVF